MKRFFLLSAILLLTTAPVAAETISRIAAIVNQDIITTARLDREIDLVLASQTPEQNISDAQRSALRSKVLDKLIEDTLVQQRVEQLGIKVSDEDIEQAINDVQQKNNINREQLTQALAAQGLTFEEYRENLRQQLLNFKLVGREIQSKIEITNAEMRDYYRAHMDDYRMAPYIRLSRITFRITPGDGAAEIAAKRATAQAALEQLRQGKEFFEVLMQYATTSGVDGGDMGEITEGSLSDSFNRAVAGLQAGQVTDLVETAEGFHILRMEERHSGETRPFEVVKDQIQAKLLDQKRQEALDHWAEDLRKNADIEIRL